MFKKPFSFEGRIRRTEYGVSMIVYAILLTIIPFVVTACFADDFGRVKEVEIRLLSFVLSIPVVIFLWAQGAKRCHDFGKNGWWQLIPLFPIYMLFKAGDATDNEYGANPKINFNTENF